MKYPINYKFNIFLDESNAQSAFTLSKLTTETLEQGVTFEHISHFVLVFLLLTLSG